MELLKRQSEKIQKVRARRRQSDTQMDLLKIYGIFCVAYAHCFAHGFRFLGHGLISSVYVIQLFIFASGYFFQRDTEPVKDHIRRCARAYLLPFFVWNLLYGLGCTVLAKLGAAQFGSTLSLYTIFLRPWIDNEQFLLNLPSWFLLSLFQVAVVQFLIRRVLRPLGRPRTELGLLGVYFALSIVAVWISGDTEQHGPETIPLRLFVLLPYYQLGIVYRTWRDKLPKLAGLPVILLGGAVLFLGSGGFQTKMLYCYFVGNPILIVLAALCAVLIVAEISRLVSPLVQGLGPVYLWGRSTMYIMLHHMFVIYCIQAVWFLWNHIAALPGYAPGTFRASIWYRYDFGHPALLIVYLLAGLCIPVGVHILYEQLLLRLAKSK